MRSVKTPLTIWRRQRRITTGRRENYMTGFLACWKSTNLFFVGWTWPKGRLHWRQERRSEEHTSELQSRPHLVCRLLLEKKKLNIRRAFRVPSAGRLGGFLGLAFDRSSCAPGKGVPCGSPRLGRARRAPLWALCDARGGA